MNCGNSKCADEKFNYKCNGKCIKNWEPCNGECREGYKLCEKEDYEDIYTFGILDKCIRNVSICRGNTDNSFYFDYYFYDSLDPFDYFDMF